MRGVWGKNNRARASTSAMGSSSAPKTLRSSASSAEGMGGMRTSRRGKEGRAPIHIGVRTYLRPPSLFLAARRMRVAPMPRGVSGGDGSGPAPPHDLRVGRGSGRGRRELRRRVDDRLDLLDPVGGEAAAAGVLADGLLVRGDVDAVHLVAGDERLHPVVGDVHLLQHAVGRAGDAAELLGGHGAGAGDLPFDDELAHGGTSWGWGKGVVM